MRKVNFIDTPSLEKARERKKDFSVFNYGYIPSDNLFSFFKGRKFFIRTYGCQANIRDEETMAGLLTSLGLIRVENKEECDVAIINTCAVRENAEDKVYGEIGEFKKLKATNKSMILCICGCMIEQKHILDMLLEKFDYIDIIFGTHNIQDLIKLFDTFIKEPKTRLVDVSSKSGDIYEGLPCNRNDKFKAYVNIAYGCNKFCTYCIVPYTRGKERSRDIEDILKECKDLVEKGYQEITLLGQNVDSYGKDLNTGIDFAYLLDKVAELNIPRLRFLTSYPSDFKDDVIDVMAKHKNIMKFIHLPIQSGSDEVLRAMGRRYTSEEYLSLVNRIKEKIPEIELSTDIIVGFPNETYDQFLETVEVAKKVEYISAFTFIYSPRKGTPAARIKDNVLYSEKVERFKYLVKELEVGFEKKADEMVGKVYPILVEGPSKKDKTLLTGITETMKTVHFKGNENLIGKIVNVRIKESHLYSLIGELINE